MKKHSIFLTARMALSIFSILLILLVLKLDLSNSLILLSFTYLYISSVCLIQIQANNKKYLNFINLALSLALALKSTSLSCGKCVDFSDYIVPFFAYLVLLIIEITFIYLYIKFLNKKNVIIKYRALLEFLPIIMFNILGVILILLH